MKVLVIGKNGQMGQELMRQASDFWFEVVGTTREECDVTNPSQVREVVDTVKPDILINTSAYNLVTEAENDPDKALALNTVAPFRLAQLCVEKSIRYVTVSTDYVFDGLKGRPYIETDHPNPVQMYGISKFAGELAVRNVDPQALIIRTAAVYGGLTGSREKKGNFVLYVLKEIETKSELEVSSEQITSPTFAGHLAKSTYQLLHNKAPGGLYHLANSGYCSWAELAQEVVRLKGADLKIIPVDRGGKSGSMQRPLFSALENTTAKAVGVELPAWQTGVSAYLESL